MASLVRPSIRLKSNPLVERIGKNHLNPFVKKRGARKKRKMPKERASTKVRPIAQELISFWPSSSGRAWLAEKWRARIPRLRAEIRVMTPLTRGNLNKKLFSEKSFLFKFPLVRGVIALISALSLGIRALHFSANQALPEGEGQKEISSWAMGLTFVLALSFGIFLFFLAPLFLTKGLRWFFPILSTSGLLFNLMDGLIRLAIFLAYIRAISFLKEIERVFQYHGAEHKSIFAFEAGEALSVERVKKFGYLHPRCGTNFLLIVMVVSVFIFALIPHHLPFGYKVASRVIFIPFIAGLSYEITRFADRKRNRRGIRFLIQPGLWLQRLTDRGPPGPQIEVALRALQEVVGMGGQG